MVALEGTSFLVGVDIDSAPYFVSGNMLLGYTEIILRNALAPPAFYPLTFAKRKIVG